MSLFVGNREGLVYLLEVGGSLGSCLNAGSIRGTGSC